MQQEQTNSLGFCPSFSYYTSGSLASTAAGRVSTLLQDEEEFEFSVVIGDEELSAGDIDSVGRTDFPLFNREILIQNEVDRDPVQGKLEEEGIGCSDSLEKLFINERGESASSSSDESDDVESPGVFCVWRHKLEAGSSPISKCKKSRSTGSGSSGSKRWRIRDLLRRSSSAVKEPMVLLTRKKLEVSKQRISNSGEGSVVAEESRASSPSIHELFYVQQRAKREGVKKKSYLPYRQGLVGFFSNVNE
ncbi:hypothetical protein R6Q57_026658 [Mikania cordata]